MKRIVRTAYCGHQIDAGLLARGAVAPGGGVACDVESALVIQPGDPVEDEPGLVGHGAGWGRYPSQTVMPE